MRGFERFRAFAPHIPELLPEANGRSRLAGPDRAVPDVPYSMPVVGAAVHVDASKISPGEKSHAVGR